MELFKPLVSASNTLPAILLIVFMIHLFWFFGLHGANIFLGLVTPITMANLATNQAIMTGTAAAGTVPAVFADGFMPMFVYAGGSGATIGLCLLMSFSKAKQLREVGRLSIAPGLFNINEPVIFGTPMVMNPIMGIPFIGIPLINATIAYLVMKSGAIGYISVTVPWTTPAPLIALFGTNFNVGAMILSIGLIALAMLVYLPFLRVYEKTIIIK